MSALPLKADIAQCYLDVRFGPKADIGLGPWPRRLKNGPGLRGALKYDTGGHASQFAQPANQQMRNSDPPWIVVPRDRYWSRAAAVS
jgi:hypothetical protein